jgi:MSHA biogenesis protein MshM
MYEAYFGLAQLPFCIAPDSRFYVDTAAHRAAIQALKDRLQRGDEFVLLSGDHGCGKTMVGRRLIEELRGPRHLAGELPRERLEGDQLFDRVAEALGLRRGGGLPPLGSLVHKLEDLAYNGGDAVLLVDDAHRLDAGTLRRLRKLTAIRVEDRTALRVCLVGQTMPLDFEAMQSSGRRLSFGAPVRVGALDAAGTHDYVLTRLCRVGWWGRPAFDAATVAIHERCKGNPLRINRLCDHLLLYLCREGRDHATADDVRVVDDTLQSEFQPLSVAGSLEIDDIDVFLDVLPDESESDSEPARLSSEALLSRLIGQGPPSVPARESRFPQSRPPLSPPPWDDSEPPYDPGDDKPGLPRWAQGAVAVALLAGGGLLWQMIPNGSAADAAPQQLAQPGPTEAPPQSTVAGLADMAEQAIAQSPTAAGATLQAAPVTRLAAALSPASGPRSSPPAR